jgi:hypothetical protein
MLKLRHSFRYDVGLLALGVLTYLLPSQVTAQVNPPAKKPQTKASKTAKGEEPNPLALQRRTVAISLLTSLAEEARSFQDQSLRARVQVRAADALWESDTEKARALFRRAWEAAVSADKDAWQRYSEERQRISSSSEPNRYLQSPPELRNEVMRLVAKRDRELAEEFLTQLTDDTARDTSNPAGSLNPGTPQTADPESPPMAIVQRLQLAMQLLQDGDVGRALQFAEPALDRVTTRGVFFLSTLREKDTGAADQRFAAMLAKTVADPSSDAVGVSVLSSYVFTPFLYIIVRGNGNNHSSQSRERIAPPQNFPPELRRSFLAGAAQILLRPPPPVDQDRTIAGRRGLYFTIARLLPLYEQYAPELAPELRVQLSSLAADIPEDLRTGRDRLLTRGLASEEQNRDEGSETLERADRVSDPTERDLLYARAALIAARKGDASARDLVEKIAESEMRKGARSHVDFTLVSRALDRKDPQEALRLLAAAELSNIHRAWALLEIAGQLKKTDAPRAVELLNESAVVARRIGGSEVDRPRAMMGVATLMFEIDRGRVWEAVSEAVKSANAVSEFSGEDAQVVARFSLGRGTTTSNMSVEGFNVEKVFSSLAKEDLYRTIEVARGFTADAPRATASLAVARAVLETKN